MHYARRPFWTLLVAAASSLAVTAALASATFAAPTPTPTSTPTPAAFKPAPMHQVTPSPTPSPTATPTPIAYPLRETYRFETHVKYVNYPYNFALANNYVQCRIDLGKYFYGDDLSKPILKPTAAMTAQPTVTYESSQAILVHESDANTVPSPVSSLTYSCTLFGTGANGSQVYLPNVAPVGPGSVLYVTGTFAPNRSGINVVQPLVLVGPTPAPQMQPVRQPSKTGGTSTPQPLPNGTVTPPPSSPAGSTSPPALPKGTVTSPPH